MSDEKQRPDRPRDMQRGDPKFQRPRKIKVIPRTNVPAQIVPIPLWKRGRQIKPALNPKFVRRGMIRRDI